MAILRLLRACSFLALIVSLSGSAHAIGAAGDTEWPAGASIETQLSLAASIGDNGQPRIEGTLTVTNPGNAPVTVQKPTNRLVLAFLVFDALGNPVAPIFRAKSDPAFDTRPLEPKAKFTHAFVGLDFVTGSAQSGYDLKRGQRYRVIAVYRPAGSNGPGFTTPETSVQIPE
jgi:hypothetical protein